MPYDNLKPLPDSVNIAIRLMMVLLILAVVAGLFFYHRELLLLWEAVKSGDTHPVYVIAVFIILPVFGFPILPLLFLVGTRFGSIIGSIIVFALIPIHLSISFWITNYVFRQPIEKMIKQRSLKIPNIPDAHRLKYSMLFMILPGLSYSLKNYILPLSGLPFVLFMICGWVIQSLLGIPFVVLGDAASSQWGICIFACIAVLYLFFLIFGHRLSFTFNCFQSGSKQNLGRRNNEHQNHQQ